MCGRTVFLEWGPRWPERLTNWYDSHTGARSIKQALLTSNIWSAFNDLGRLKNERIVFFLARPPLVICAKAFNHKVKKLSIYRGFSEIVFLKETSQEDGRTLNWIMKTSTLEHWRNWPPKIEFKNENCYYLLNFLVKKLDAF